MARTASDGRSRRPSRPGIPGQPGGRRGERDQHDRDHGQQAAGLPQHAVRRRSSAPSGSTSSGWRSCRTRCCPAARRRPRPNPPAGRPRSSRPGDSPAAGCRRRTVARARAGRRWSAYTSNGSAAPIQRRPPSTAPMIMITSQARTQTRITFRVVRSGWTSSSQAKANRDRAAGQTPSRAGQLDQTMIGIGPGQPAESEVEGAQRVDHPPDRPHDQRQRDEPDPQPDEHEAEHGVGELVRSDRHRETDPGEQGQHEQPGHRTDGPVVHQGLDPGDRDARDRRRTCGCRQASSRTAKEIASAAAAPIRTKPNGSGRSCRDAMPCRGISGTIAGIAVTVRSRSR